jgi:energy-coupling factor transporter ATP-binding protein EcfA2
VPIPCHRVDGDGNLVVIVGENASGKSFLRRILTALCREADIEMMPISMEGRGGSYGGLRGFIYGDESWQSTGECSSVTVVTGIKTCQGREKPHVIFWDEPDLGLSDGWAAGMGIALRQFADTMPKLTYGAFVVTHSRALVSELLPANPHYLHVGTDPANAPPTLEAWVNRPIKARPIEELRDESYRRFKMIQAILDGKKTRDEDR